MKKVFIFTSVHSWDDIRIFKKEAVSLAKHFKVELHAPAEFKTRRLKGVDIFGLTKWYKRKDRRSIRKLLRKRLMISDADIFHFHDPELIFYGIYLKLFRHKKIIYDVHENVGRQIFNKDYLRSYFLKFLISKVYNFIQLFAIKIFDVVIVAGDDILNFYSHRKIIYNYPIIKKNEYTDINTRENSFAYIGGVTKIRGITEALEAVKLLNNRLGKKYKLKLIGEFEDSKFKEDILSKYHDEVDYLGWLPQNKAHRAIKSCLAGFALYQPVPNHFYLRSNKVFEYLKIGLPVIYPNYSDWVAKLGNGEIGFAVKPTDPHKICEKLLIFTENPSIINKFSKKARKLVYEKFNWKDEETKLIEIYNKL